MTTVTYDTLATRREDEDYPRESGGNTLGDQGETQTRDTGGSFLKREGKLVFKIKPEMTRQCTKTKSVCGS